MLDSLDPTAAPCDSFFDYACGNWPTVHPMPGSRSSYNSFSVLNERNTAALRRLLTALHSDDTAADPTAKAKAFYSKCMDITAIEAQGAAPATELLASARWTPANPSGAWATADWTQLATALATLHGVGVSPLFEPWTLADQHNPTTNVVHLYAGEIGLGSREYFIGKNATTDPYLLAYKQYASTVLELAGVAASATEAEATATAVIAFETSLASIMLSKAELRRPARNYNPANETALAVLLEPFPWHEYAHRYWGPYRNLSVTPLPTPIIIASGGPSAYFGAVMATVAATPVETVIAYLQLRVLSFAVTRLSSAFVDASFTLSKALTGVKEPQERWKTCVGRTDSALGFVVGRAFVDALFPASSREAAVEMIAGIKTAFSANLPSVAWMDNATRHAAAMKADLVYEMIGYPPYITNDTALGEHYAAMAIEVNSTQSYFSAALAANRFEVRTNILDLDVPVDRTRWGMSPPTVNAYYSPLKNEIVFPAGILQAPFWHGAGAISALNYGGIGAVIGHELTHGFDDQGAEYDGHGTLTKWWPESVKAAFDEKTQCISAEYSKFSIASGEHVNGNLTTGENIADNGGIKMAYNAWQASGPPASRLPGLPTTTPEQLFFLSFAQVWCGVQRPEQAHQSILTDPHSPHRFRVDGVMRNSVEFANAFGCPVGSPLNPPDKCVVW